MRRAYGLVVLVVRTQRAQTSSRLRASQHRGIDQPCFLSHKNSMRISHELIIFDFENRSRVLRPGGVAWRVFCPL